MGRIRKGALVLIRSGACDLMEYRTMWCLGDSSYHSNHIKLMDAGVVKILSKNV